jgi:hypothetical protein
LISDSFQDIPSMQTCYLHSATKVFSEILRLLFKNAIFIAPLTQCRNTIFLVILMMKFFMLRFVNNSDKREKRNFVGYCVDWTNTDCVHIFQEELQFFLLQLQCISKSWSDVIDANKNSNRNWGFSLRKTIFFLFNTYDTHHVNLWNSLMHRHHRLLLGKLKSHYF